MLVPFNDPLMLAAQANGHGVASSPFVIAMRRLDIPFLPDLVNAIVITSKFGPLGPRAVVRVMAILIFLGFIRRMVLHELLAISSFTHALRPCKTRAGSQDPCPDHQGRCTATSFGLQSGR
jgi:hypothetical protein